MHTRRNWLIMVLAVSGLGLAGGISRAGEMPTAPTLSPPPSSPSQHLGSEGRFRQKSGAIIDYVYVFNRNAIRDFEIGGRKIVALTESSNLLLLSLPDYKIVAERCDIGETLNLIQSRTGEIVACCTDGRLIAVDADSLNWRPVADVKRAIVGAGFSSMDMPWVVHADRVPEVQEVSTGKHYPAPPAENDLCWGAMLCHMDGRDRLWVASNRGEFGQNLWMFDLATRKWHGPYAGLDDPIRDFEDEDDGSVLACGGLQHLGGNSGFLARLEGLSLKSMTPNRTSEQERRSLRRFPQIEQIIRNPFTKKLCILVSDETTDLYQQDQNSWRRLRMIHAGADPPAFTGSRRLPPVTEARFLDAKTLILATRGSGFILSRPDGQNQFIQRRQLERGDITQLLSDRNETFIGLGLFNSGPGLYRWKSGALERIDFVSQIPAPTEESVWEQWQALGATASTLLGRIDSTGDIRAFVQIKNGVVTTSATDEDAVDRCVLTPDGTLWAIDPLPAEIETGFQVVETGGTCKLDSPVVKNDDGPPWYVMDYWGDELVELDGDPTKAEGGKCRCRELVTKDVLDAAVVKPGVLILLFEDRLETWVKGFREPLKIPGLDLKSLAPRRLARTKDGRLWIGGNGLVMRDSKGLHRFTDFPPLQGAAITTMAPDRENPAGVWIATSNRGALRLSYRDGDRKNGALPPSSP